MAIAVNNEPLSIAKMDTWSFWTSAGSIGSTEDEMRAVGRREVAPERVMELEVLTRLAFNHLVTAEPAGRA